MLRKKKLQKRLLIQQVMGKTCPNQISSRSGQLDRCLGARYDMLSQYSIYQQIHMRKPIDVLYSDVM